MMMIWYLLMIDDSDDIHCIMPFSMIYLYSFILMLLCSMLLMWCLYVDMILMLCILWCVCYLILFDDCWWYSVEVMIFDDDMMMMMIWYSLKCIYLYDVMIWWWWWTMIPFCMTDIFGIVDDDILYIWLPFLFWCCIQLSRNIAVLLWYILLMMMTVDYSVDGIICCVCWYIILWWYIQYDILMMIHIFDVWYDTDEVIWWYCLVSWWYDDIPEHYDDVL